MKILFVDDEKDLLELGKIFLTKENPNLDVETTNSPKKGIEKIKKDDFDAIVSDYDMPRMNGLEFYKELKNNGYANIPFIVFTGCGEKKVEKKFKEVGADDYLEKGSNPKEKFTVLANEVIENVVNEDNC